MVPLLTWKKSVTCEIAPKKGVPKIECVVVSSFAFKYMPDISLNIADTLSRTGSVSTDSESCLILSMDVLDEISDDQITRWTISHEHKWRIQTIADSDE